MGLNSVQYKRSVSDETEKLSIFTILLRNFDDKRCLCRVLRRFLTDFELKTSETD